MTFWVTVREDEIRNWVHDIEPDEYVQCFQLKSSRGIDGPWSYVLFVINPAQRGEIVTTYFATVYIEALDAGENPLNSTSGIVLTLDEARELIMLLEDQINNMPDYQGLPISTLEPIETDEYTEYHLNQIGDNYAEEHYYRLAQSQQAVSPESDSTIFLFSKDRQNHDSGLNFEIMESIKNLTHHYEKLYFGVMQFSNSQLQYPEFRPRDHALPRAFLSRRNMKALIALFQKFIA